MTVETATITVAPPESGHQCLVARIECGCLMGVHVLGYNHDADAYKDAAGWAKKGASIQQMLVSEFKKGPPWRCPGHPNGAWDSRGRLRPLATLEFGL